MTNRPSCAVTRPEGEVASFPVDPTSRQGQLVLLKAVGRGDTASFIKLFNHFAPRLKAFMKRMGAPDAVADDLAQDAMVAVWRKAGTYDPDKSAAASWIFAIARNLRIDGLRRDRRAELDPNDPLLVPEPPPTPDMAVDTLQLQRRVRAALGTLPRDQAAVIGLAFYQGLSHGDIAAELAIPIGTVKSRMRLAFQRMRVALGEADARSAARLAAGKSGLRAASAA